MNPKPSKPVFIVGSPRSGTTWLHHLLLSSGSFAIYRSESQVYSRFASAFSGRPSSSKRKRFLDNWLKSEFFLRSGLDADSFQGNVLANVDSPGDFLRILMEEICAQQDAPRWAECTPDHGLYIEQIKRDFPDALFIHIVRDGRDVALSLARKGFVKPMPWGTYRSESAAAVYWSWITRRIANSEDFANPGFLTVHYEDLVSSLQSTLQRIAEFIDKPIDLQTIAQTPVGSVAQPNTSFEGDKGQVGISRWRSHCDPELLRALEDFASRELKLFGYRRSTPEEKQILSCRIQEAAYRLQFEIRHNLRRRNLAGARVPANWDSPDPSKTVTDPTLRPGQNLLLIKKLVDESSV